MNTPNKLGIVESFERIWKREATAEEAERLHLVQSTLGVRDNDAIWVVMIALEHYQQLYQAMPRQIEEAGRTAIGEVRQTAERVANTAAQLAHNDLVASLGDAVNAVAASAARKQQWVWLAAGIGVAAIALALTSVLTYQQGKEAGKEAGYREARVEGAAAAWGGTPEGRLAYRMVQAGSLQQVARCNQPGWEVSNGVCFAKAAKDGNLYGWSLPQ